MSMHVYAYNFSIHVKFVVILVVICTLYTTNFLWCIWYLLDNHKNFHKNRTSFSLNMMVSLLSQVECMLTCAGHACAHMHAHQHYKSTQETNPEICWKFGEVLTSFGWDIELCYLSNTQTNMQTQLKFIIDFQDQLKLIYML